jgi:V8-like Glu-specific endopeptidase
MRSILFACVGLMACGVETGEPLPDPSTATPREHREFAVAYDMTSHEVTRDDAVSLEAIRRGGGPRTLEGTVVADDDPITGYEIMGADQRQRVTPTTSFPVAARSRLAMTFPDGYSADCSGHLVGNKYALTAGHCVHSQDHGGWATSISVFPGQDGNSKPFGGGVAVNIRSTVGWVDDEDDDVDYALLTLDKKLGDTIGWFGLAYLGDDTLDNEPNVTLAGYPADKPWGTQWSESGPIVDYSDDHLFYNIDSFGGDSGAGLGIILNTNRHYVTGVHHGTGYYWLSEYNMAVRITSARFNQIEGWVQSGF